MAGRDHPSSLAGVFGLPFAEQIAFFRSKLGNLVPTQRWDDLIGVEHDRAFMVAGAAKADLLNDLAMAVDKAISEGRGIDDFRRDFRQVVARNGWTGWTGEGSVRGEAWRVGVIYRTNAYTSYAAGRLAQLRAGKFRFWVYRHGGSLEPRPVHLGWDGLVLPPEHPFWATHYPPSDWGCSCYVVGARSEAGARRLGGKPDKQLAKGWDRTDPKTGAPIGIGKGWGYAPGASVADLISAIAGKIRSWDHRIAKAFFEALPAAQADPLAVAYRSLPSTADDASAFARKVWDEGEMPQPGRTLGRLTSEQVAAANAGRKGIDVTGCDFSLSPDEALHVKREHGDPVSEAAKGQRAITPDAFSVLPRILNGATPRYVGISDRHKVPTFELAMAINGEEYVTRWEYWAKRRTLTLLSFFIRTGERS